VSRGKCKRPRKLIRKLKRPGSRRRDSRRRELKETERVIMSEMTTYQMRNKEFNLLQHQKSKANRRLLQNPLLKKKSNLKRRIQTRSRRLKLTFQLSKKLFNCLTKNFE